MSAHHSLEDELASTPALVFDEPPPGGELPHHIDYGSELEPDGGEQQPPPGKGGRVVFSAELVEGATRLGDGAGGDGGTTISYHDDDEEEEEEHEREQRRQPRRPIAPPSPPRASSSTTTTTSTAAADIDHVRTAFGNGSAGGAGATATTAAATADAKSGGTGRKAGTPYAQLRALTPPDLIEVLEQQHATATAAGLQDTDIVWSIANGILAPLVLIRTLPERLAKMVDRSAGEAADRLADAAGTLNAEHVGDRIVARVAPRLGDTLERELMQPAAKRLRIEVAKHRWRWLSLGIGGGAVLPLLGVLVGFWLGRSADLGSYREEYVQKAAELPTIAAFVQRDLGARVYSLALRNPDAVLRQITTCSSDLGLRIVKSTTGERVCTGGPNARSAWRLP